jgi:phosphate:Na+ symporter
MIYLETIFYILGGLVVVIYGVGLLGKNVQKIMGERLEKVLKKAEGKPTVKGLIAGIATTSLVQSSSIVILILMAFVSADLFSADSDHRLSFL